MSHRKAPDDDTLRAMWGSGLSDSQVGARIGMDSSNARRHRIRLGIEPNRPKSAHELSDSDRELVIELATRGLTADEIVTQVGCSDSTVYRICRQMGVKLAPGRKPLFSDERVKELHDIGYGTTRIAKELGCNPRTVQRVKTKLGIADARPKLPPLEERLELAEDMLDDGAPFEMITAQLHIHDHTLRKYFPGRSWSRDQVVEWAAISRNANKVYKKLGV